MSPKTSVSKRTSQARYQRGAALLAICSPETSVDFQQTTWHYIPEDRTLHKHRCENVKILYMICNNYRAYEVTV
jgi:hypothetical protein